jgi:hypothetical protein
MQIIKYQKFAEYAFMSRGNIAFHFFNSFIKS